MKRHHAVSLGNNLVFLLLYIHALKICLSNFTSFLEMPAIVYYNKISAIIMTNPIQNQRTLHIVQHQRTLHIEHDIHFVQDKIVIFIVHGSSCSFYILD